MPTEMLEMVSLRRWDAMRHELSPAILIAQKIALDSKRMEEALRNANGLASLTQRVV